MRPQRRLAGEIEAALRSGSERRRQPGFGHARHRQPRPCRGCVQDQLPRNAERVGEDGAQALVARDQVAQRRLERVTVERAASRTASGML